MYLFYHQSMPSIDIHRLVWCRHDAQIGIVLPCIYLLPTFGAPRLTCPMFIESYIASPCQLTFGDVLYKFIILARASYAILVKQVIVN